MNGLRLNLAALLLLTGMAAHADPCKITIQSNDLMQFNAHELSVPASCPEVEVTLRHSGQLPAQVMGHNWVLARDSDMAAIVNAGRDAGRAHGYLAEHDRRVIAATGVVGGGESATVKFSTAGLAPGERYAFFCTSPGHSAVMHGSFVMSSTRVAQAEK